MHANPCSVKHSFNTASAQIQASIGGHTCGHDDHTAGLQVAVATLDVHELLQADVAAKAGLRQVRKYVRTLLMHRLCCSMVVPREARQLIQDRLIQHETLLKIEDPMSTGNRLRGSSG